MNTLRHIHVIHLLIRTLQSNGVAFLVYPHDKWKNAGGNVYLTLPTKRSVDEPLAPYLQGTSLEHFVDTVARDDLGLRPDDYVLEQEIEPAEKTLDSPTSHVSTQYTIYPVDVWVDPAPREPLRSRVNGRAGGR